MTLAREPNQLLLNHLDEEGGIREEERGRDEGGERRRNERGGKQKLPHVSTTLFCVAA